MLLKVILIRFLYAVSIQDLGEHDTHQRTITFSVKLYFPTSYSLKPFCHQLTEVPLFTRCFPLPLLLLNKGNLSLIWHVDDLIHVWERWIYHIHRCSVFNCRYSRNVGNLGLFRSLAQYQFLWNRSLSEQVSIIVVRCNTLKSRIVWHIPGHILWNMLRIIWNSLRQIVI